MKFHYKIYYNMRKAYIIHPDYKTSRHKTLKKNSFCFNFHTFKYKINTLIWLTFPYVLCFIKQLYVYVHQQYCVYAHAQVILSMALFSKCHNEMGYTLYFHYKTCLNERFLSSLLNTYKHSLASKEIYGCKIT